MFNHTGVMRLSAKTGPTSLSLPYATVNDRTDNTQHNWTLFIQSYSQTELRGLSRRPAVDWGRLPLLGQAVCGTTVSICISYRPCLELLDDVYLVASVDLPLQLTPHEEVQRHELRALPSQGLWPDEDLACLPQKRLDTEWPDFIDFVKI